MTVTLGIILVGWAGKMIPSHAAMVNCNMAWAGLPSTMLDKDCDRLADTWETSGKDGINFPALGANPNVKDIFVEIDYITHHRPRDASLAAVTTAFANSGIVNVAGYPTGIRVHFIINENIGQVPPGDSCTPVSSFPSLKNTWFGTASERLNPTLRAAKWATFHYGLFIHTQCGATTSSGTGETPGGDFIVSLGGPGWGKDASGNVVGSEVQQSGTLMHELGHNLGLYHGGNVAVNCKPNYASVMNWIFQVKGYVANTPNPFPDYSKATWGPLGGLPETSLNEAAGIGPVGYNTAIGGRSSPPPYFNVVPTGVPIKYNTDANTTNATVTRNLNNFGYPSPIGEDFCNSILPPPANTLFSYKDWGDALKFWGTNFGWDAVDPIDPITGLPIIVSTVESVTGSNQSTISGNNNTNQITANYIYNHTDFTIENLRSARLQLVQGINNEIQILPDAAFANTTSVNNTKAGFEQELIGGNTSIANLTQSDKLGEAIEALNMTRAKMDSSFGGDPNDDLIIETKAQQIIVPLIDNLMLVLIEQR